MRIAEWILWALGAYAAIGVLFAGAFVALGVTRVDHAARGSRWAFRLLIFPGAAALWPVMLRKWFAASRRTGERHP